MRGLEGLDVICLKGNHEDMMLACLGSGDRQVWWPWISNGGDETLESLGISLRFGGYHPDCLAKELGKHRVDWLNALPLYHSFGRYFFVHAGIAPGKPVGEQQEKDMLWIRDRFLKSDDDHGYIVIHGHTPTREPEIRRNRIGIDTGAVLYGQLTAVVLGEANGPRFLYVTGKPGSGR